MTVETGLAEAILAKAGHHGLKGDHMRTIAAAIVIAAYIVTQKNMANLTDGTIAFVALIVFGVGLITGW